MTTWWLRVFEAVTQNCLRKIYVHVIRIREWSSEHKGSIRRWIRKLISGHHETLMKKKINQVETKMHNGVLYSSVDCIRNFSPEHKNGNMFGGNPHSALLDRVESKALRLIYSPLFTNCPLSLKFRFLPPSSAYELPTVCLSLRGTPLHLTLLLYLTLQPSKFHMQELSSIFILSSFIGQLWNSFPLYILLPTV